MSKPEIYCVYITEADSCLAYIILMYRECMRGKGWKDFLEWLECCNSGILRLLLYKYNASILYIFHLLCSKDTEIAFKVAQRPTGNQLCPLTIEDHEKIMTMFKPYVERGDDED